MTRVPDRGHGPPSRWWTAAGLLAGAYVAVAIIWVSQGHPSLGYDALILRGAAERLLDGGAIYLDPTGERFFPGSVELYYGPPAYAVAAIPLAVVPEAAVRLGTFSVGILSAVASVAFLVRAAGASLRSGTFAAALVGLFLSLQVAWAATLGASSLLVLLLLAVAWWGFERRSDAVVAAAIGSAAALRLYPAALVLALLAAGRWRAAAVAILVAAGWWVVGLVAVGPEATRAYLGFLTSAAVFDQYGGGNVAPVGLAGELGLSPAAVSAVRIASITAGVVLLGLGGRVAARAADGGDRLLGWGLAAAGMLLVAPVAWDHYVTALVVLTTGLALSTGAATWALAPAAFLFGPISGLAMLWAPIAGIAALARGRGQRL